MKNTLKLINKYIYLFIDTVKKYGLYVKICLALLLFFWIFILSSFRFVKKYLDLNVGDIAPYDIKVKENIEYIDSIKTETKRQEVISKILPIFQFDLNILKDEKGRIDKFFNEIIKIDTEYIDLEEKIKAAYKLKLIKDKKLLEVLFLNYKLNKFHYKAKDILNKIYNAGITELTYDNMKSLSKTANIIKVYNNEQGEEISIRANIDDLFYKDKMNYPEVIKKYHENLRWDKARFLQAYIKNYIKPNLFYDKKNTDEKIVSAINSIKPVIRKLKAGRVIVRYGEEITESHFKVLNEIMKYSSETGIIKGYLILLFTIFTLSFLFFKIYGGAIFYSMKSFLFLICFIAIASALNYSLPNINKFLEAKVLSSYFVPIGGFAILISQLAGFVVSIFVLLFISIITVFIIGFSFIDFFVILFAGFFALMLTRMLKKRIYMWYLGLLIGAFYFILNLGISGINDFSKLQFTYSVIVGFANGIMSVIICMGLYPLFENIFSMLTEIKLLELSDINLPIMKRLLIEAPGTYNHSILLSNMAENAALAINANSLLARVGGYYHDIGKLEKPGHYIENQNGIENVHRKIKPSISSSIIKSHVKFGGEMARKLKLPEEIIKIIDEHHGTTMLSIFYQKALKMKDTEGLSKNDIISAYKYEGPRPTGKESAIILLADAVEAASRSLKQPSYHRLENIVRELINTRFLDGQLDDCPLTLKDLNKIADSFSHVLSAMYHTLIESPAKK